ncbi:MAG: hypothetical protein HZA54_12625 [Planctomycetes bacterium]|nr:hypothetical protein [Planctomycetota bacterium]
MAFTDEEAPAAQPETACPACGQSAVERRRVRSGFGRLLIGTGIVATALSMRASFTAFEWRALAAVREPDVTQDRLERALEIPVRPLLGMIPAIGLFVWGLLHPGAERLLCRACGWSRTRRVGGVHGGSHRG